MHAVRHCYTVDPARTIAAAPDAVAAVEIAHGDDLVGSGVDHGTDAHTEGEWIEGCRCSPSPQTPGCGSPAVCDCGCSPPPPNSSPSDAAASSASSDTGRGQM